MRALSLAVALALALAACGSAPPDYTSATTCAARIVTGPNTSYLDGNSQPGFTTYVVAHDSNSQSRADCDADIAYEGMATRPTGDSVTILNALPKGLTVACSTGTGMFAWYGSVDVTIYATDFIDGEGVSSACVPNPPCWSGELITDCLKNSNNGVAPLPYQITP